MFYLAPHPKLDRPLRGSPRMFKIDWVEKYFSRVRPRHVVAIWVPFALWCLYRAARDEQLPLAGVCGLFALGLLAWTLLEYTLHRFVFHFEPNERVGWQRDLSWLIHGVHHDYPHDPDRLVMPPIVTAIIAGALWAPVKSLFGAHYHYAFFAGLVMGYVWYDLTHYYLHFAAPRTAVGKWLRRHHLVHHFATPDVRYGITTPLWDLVFGTYPKGRASVSESELQARG